MFSTVALIGNPNSGKTSLFNLLTGMRQNVSNYAGVTVEKKVGQIEVAGQPVRLLDLPGSYSLHPNSADERVVLDILLDKANEEFPDLLLYVADATQLSSQLLLLSQVLDLHIPTILLLNMGDLARLTYDDVERISTYFGCPTYLISSRDTSSSQTIISAIKSYAETEMSADLSTSQNGVYHQKLIAIHFEKLSFLRDEERQKLKENENASSKPLVALQIEDVMSRYAELDMLLAKLDSPDKSNAVNSWSSKIDAWTCHPVVGPLIFLLVLTVVFNALFSLAQLPMEWIDVMFGNAQSWVEANMPEGWFTDLLSNGLIAGLGGVVIFIPQIFFLFFLLGLLEEVGYMSRVVYMFDGLMRRFGMNGRSVVSLVASGACAIPAVMSTRTICNWKERLITILVAPFISCSARLPVYAILISLAITKKPIFGFLNTQGLTLMGLYVLSAATALGTGWVLNKTAITKSISEASYLAMELPSYKMPSLKNVLLDVWGKVRSFIVEAGKIILVISVLLWVLASYGPGDQMKMAEMEAQQEAIERSYSPEETEKHVASMRLENSYIGLLGRYIEPVIRPLGYNWKIGIALLTSFAAREVFVGTMATIFSVDESNETTLLERMKSARTTEGRPIFTFATSMSLLIFYMLAMQCMSTLAVVRKETNSWKWPVLQFIGMTSMAYVCSFIVYQFLS